MLREGCSRRSPSPSPPPRLSAGGGGGQSQHDEPQWSLAIWGPFPASRLGRSQRPCGLPGRIALFLLGRCGACWASAGNAQHLPELGGDQQTRGRAQRTHFPCLGQIDDTGLPDARRQTGTHSNPHGAPFSKTCIHAGYLPYASRCLGRQVTNYFKEGSMRQVPLLLLFCCW